MIYACAYIRRGAHWEENQPFIAEIETCLLAITLPIASVKSCTPSDKSVLELSWNTQAVSKSSLVHQFPRQLIFTLQKYSFVQMNSWTQFKNVNSILYNHGKIILCLCFPFRFCNYCPTHSTETDNLNRKKSQPKSAYE